MNLDIYPAALEVDCDEDFVKMTFPFQWIMTITTEPIHKKKSGRPVAEDTFVPPFSFLCVLF